MSGSDSRPAIVEAMLDPAFYPGGPESVELRETHISWVFLAAGRAYKVKKPVELPFLDYSTPERRHEMCREEVRLNRRLAPDFYLGVRGIARRGDRLELAGEADPGAVEYAVEMNAVPRDRTLDFLTERGRLEPGELGAVGRRLAAFHRGAPAADDPAAALADLVGSLEENHRTLASVGPPELPEDRLASAERFTRACLVARRDQLSERARRGLVRDGHGDLRAEHVIVIDPVQVYDCVEFDPALREIDVAADLAFLVMDLARLGAERESGELVAAYREAGGDPGDDGLLAFLASYRAWVRAKVACLRAREEEIDHRERERALTGARELLALGHRFAWRARTPLALVVCGPAGTGKTTVAERLGQISGLPVISSDRVRKRLAGIEPTEHARPEHYAPGFGRRTYAELARLADETVGANGGVIVDATFTRRSDRDMLRERLGGADGVLPILFAECRAPAETVLERTTARQADPGAISDADPDVARRQLEAFEDLTEVPPERHAVVPTDAPLADSVVEAEALADRALLHSGGD